MKLKYFFRILIAFTIISIFYFSNQPISISAQQSNFVYNLLPIKFISALEFFNIDIRKFAHFIIYLVFGFFINLSFKIKSKKQLLVTILLIFSFAVLDELHQNFIPGRGPRFSDVLIDISGAILGIFIAKIFQIVFKFL